MYAAGQPCAQLDRRVEAVSAIPHRQRDRSEGRGWRSAHASRACSGWTWCRCSRRRPGRTAPLLRPDLAEMLAGLKPAFVRFPGGCWVEGNTMDLAYRWKQTIGDISDAARSSTSGTITRRTAWASTSTCRCARTSGRAAVRDQLRHVAPRERPAGPDGGVRAGRVGRDRVLQWPGGQPVGIACGPRPAIRLRST